MVARRQERQFEGDVAIHRNRNVVLDAMDKLVVSAGNSSGNDIAKLESDLHVFFNRQIPRTTAPIQDDEKRRWSNRLIIALDAEPSPGHVWCPITKHFGPNDWRKAVLLVPRILGTKTIGHLLNGKGDVLLWDMTNGLIMNYVFAIAFEKLDFCLIPYEDHGKAGKIKLVLINECIRHEEAYNGKTWDEYDGIFLEFRNHKRYFTPGWEKLRSKVENGGLWVIPGKYLQKSMVNLVGLFPGDGLQEEQKSIAMYTFDDSKSQPKKKMSHAQETILAKDLFRVLASSYCPGHYHDDEEYVE